MFPIKSQLNKMHIISILICILILSTLVLNACAGNVAAPMQVEVTRQVDVTHIVEVTRVVEVTKIVNIPPTLIPATAAPTASPLQPADSRASKYLGGNASPVFPDGEPGKLSVIQLGTGGRDNLMYIAVRNNTVSCVTYIAVSSVVYTADGKLYATGGDQGFNPAFICPGEIALGYQYYEDVNLPTDATYTFEATARQYDKPDNFLDLDVTEVNLVGDRLVGFFTNNQDAKVSGPISATAYCFDESSTFLSEHSDYTDKDSALPGEQIPFQISLGNDPCPIYLVAGSGYRL